MSDKRYQVFISSTYLDLEQERRAVISALQHSRFIAVGMEEFMPNGKRSLDIIKKEIDNSDYYVIITKGSYGSTTEQGISYTETEYDYAAERKMPILAFAYDEAKGEAYKLTDKDKDNFPLLKNFLEKIKEYQVGSWTTKDDLVQKVKDAVYRVTIETPGTGWVRGNAEMTPEILKELGALRSENAEMKAKLAEGNEDWKKYLEVKLRVDYKIHEKIKAKEDELFLFMGDHYIAGAFIEENSINITVNDFFIYISKELFDEPSQDNVVDYFNEFINSCVNANNYLIDIQSIVCENFMKNIMAAKLITTKRFNSYTVYQFTERGRDYYAQSVALLPENEITL